MPVKVLTAAFDPVVPRKHTDALFEALPQGRAEQIVIAGSNHNDIMAWHDSRQALRDFFQRSVEPGD